MEKTHKILVLEFSANDLKGTFRQLTRKELLDEALAASLPESVKAGALPADLMLLKARDVRKVDPVFGSRIEPVILVRTGVVLVSLGKTELRALILHDRLYFIVPDGADSVLSVVQQNLQQLREAEAGDAPAGRARNGEHDGSLVPEPPSPNLQPEGAMPFEFSALEALLMTACAELHARVSTLQVAVRDALASLRHTIGTGVVAGSKQLEAMRDLKQQVAADLACPATLPRHLHPPCAALPCFGRSMSCSSPRSSSTEPSPRCSYGLAAPANESCMPLSPAGPSPGARGGRRHGAYVPHQAAP